MRETWNENVILYMYICFFFSPTDHLSEVNLAVISGLCTPQREIARIPDGRPSDEVAYPKFTIVLKCKCGDVCENSSHRCVANNTRNVTRPFKVR